MRCLQGLRSYSAWCVTLVVLLSLTGCAYLPHKEVVGEAEPVDVPAPAPAEPNGSIFQANNQGVPFFEDIRPGLVGDVLTIVFNEEVSASKSSKSSSSRGSSATFTPTGMPKGLERLQKYGLDASGSQDFEGKGGSQAQNTFTGRLSVTVERVLNNGNLRVKGGKEIAINQGTEFIRFAGTVDPRLINADNTILSSQVADARIEYVGKGYINEAQNMGWLQRIWLNISPF